MNTTKQKLSDYYRITSKVDRLIKKHNPCDFKDGRCWFMRTSSNPEETSCCPSQCKNLNSKGCNTNNLYCKLAFPCGVLDQPHLTFLNKVLYNVKKEARELGLLSDEPYFFENIKKIKQIILK